jgi:hypothetical protein
MIREGELWYYLLRLCLQYEYDSYGLSREAGEGSYRTITRDRRDILAQHGVFESQYKAQFSSTRSVRGGLAFSWYGYTGCTPLPLLLD